MKESAYNLCAQGPDGNYYLFNTRRGAVHVMTACAYETYWAAANGASGLEVATEARRDLIDKGFLVDNDADELSEIVSAHQEARQSRERLDLLIAPSMVCNLDCFYCFESNRYAGRMSAAVQSNIARLVRRYFDSGTKRLDVTWYGGEPLLAFSVVERLSKRFLSLCEEFGREYSAEIVTNGTLMSHEKAQQLASWKVKRAQITLDGVPELHDARRVPKNRKPTFCTILDGIDAAAAHMHVSVRINVCRKVAARLEELLQILAARGLNRVVSVYVAPLQKVEDRKTLPSRGPQARVSSVAPQPDGEQLDTLDGREAADLELRFNDLLWKYGFAVSNRLPEPRCTTCMADKEHSWLIEANGDVQKCYWTAGLRAEAAGRLTEDGIAPREPYRKWQDWTAFRNTGCLQCIMLPICLGRCPLKHLNHKSDYCPAFKHNWVRVLARAAGVPDGQLVPVQLPLAGENVGRLARAGQ
jgi:uncharacterized protein